jgi:RNA polymerase sigma-70 factor (ECF subfamily)
LAKGGDEGTARPPAADAAAGDASLLGRLAAGDRAALKQAYDRYVALVHFIAKRHGLSHEDVDDVVQETFLKLSAKAGSIREGTRLKAWLVACARNLAIDKWRRQRSTGDQSAEAAVDGGRRPLWQDEGPRGAHECEIELVRELLDQVAATPGGETLRQFYRDGMSAKDIAAKNGEAISTVTTRLSRLRAKFGDELKRRIETLRASRVIE